MRILVILSLVSLSAAAELIIPRTDHWQDRLRDYASPSTQETWGAEASGDTITVYGWDEAIQGKPAPRADQLSDDATAHAAMEAKRAAQAVADTDAREQATPDMRDLKRDIAATIDGLQTNVTATAFPAGAQRQEFRDLADYVTDLAREVQRLRRREAENERGK